MNGRLPDLDFLAGGGEMGALMRGHRWEGTPLGAPAAWPESLRSTLGLCLDSAFPIAIYWGPELALLYNDAWRPILGGKHPWGLGRPAREVWPEIWEAIDPVFRQVLASGKGVFNHDSLLAMNRYGYVEECYFDYTFNPIRAGHEVAGIFNVVIETTYRVIGERRARAQRDFAARLSPARGIADVMALAAASLAESAADVPFALLYRVGTEGRDARLEHAVGITAGGRVAPRQVALDAPGGWPLGKVASSGEAEHVVDLAARFGEAPPGGRWPEPAHEALVLPILASGAAAPVALLVAGVSPRRALDLEHRSFFESLAAHMGRAITSAEAYEGERRRAEALAELDRAKTAFFSNVSHEFRTPLTLMLGPVEDLLARQDPGNRETLDVVHRNGQRLLKLVNTLLDFARIESGRAQASYEPVDLAALTADLASNFRSACERAGLELVVDCPAQSEPAFVDREMWEKIVLNLVSNAFKFTLEGAIHVSLRAHEDFVLEVRDTGSGVPAAELPRMFERFHRVEGARGRSHEGSGIGLALVSELVKLHGGTIAVASELGRGSSFTVRVPRGAAHLPAERVKTQPQEASSAVRAGAYVEEALSWLPGFASAAGAARDPHLPRVLIADDNADLREYARRLLAEHYDVEAVADGLAALAAARRRRPDVVVSDVMMPRLDGFGLIAALRGEAALREVPVILLSARAGEEARLEGLGRGADEYLVKPFSARELLVRVGTLLRAAEIRREANAALRKSEEHLRAVVDMTPECVKIVARDGRLLQMNPAGLAMVGAGGAAEVVGQSIYDVIAPEYRDAFRAFNERVCDGDKGVLEFDIVGLTGVRRRMETHAAPLRMPDGTTAHLALTRDMTERRAAEERLRESEERYAAMLGLMPAAVYTCEAPSGAITYFNEHAARLWGRAPALGDTDARFCGSYRLWRTDGSALPHAETPMALAMREGREFRNQEVVIERPNGSRITVLVNIEPLRDAQGRVRGAINVFHDVSERRRAEQALRESEARLRLFIANAPAALAMFDREMRYVAASRRWIRDYGLKDDPTGESHYALFPEMPEAWREAHRRGLAGESLGSEGDAFPRADGSLQWVKWQIHPWRNAAGEVGGILIAAEEITARKEAEERLRAADRQKDEFIATLSHELRNPLAPLRNALQLLRLAGGAADAGPIHEMMERQVNHLVRLTDDLLEMSRITRGAFELRRERLDVRSVVQSALETSEALVRSRGQRLSVELPPAPLYVDGDPVRLAQVLSNLLNNAARYTPKDGAIALRARAEDGRAVLSVRDDGAGISAEQLPRLFEMFSRGERSSGLGIGLALARRLAEMHGGSIEAASEGPGKGAEFTVRLPLAARDGQPRAAQRAEPAYLPLRRILVVDDNRDAADSLGMLLKFLGADVRVAHDGAAALEAFESYRPGVVLLDIGMPEMDGYQVARAIRRRENGARVPLVALTGWGQESDRRRARDAGFDHHLVKPADIGALQSLLASLVAH